MNPEDTLQDARERIGACADAAALKDIEREFVGKKGVVAAMLAEIPKLEPEQRKTHGQKANSLKQAILELIKQRQVAFESGKLDAARRADGFDPTLPAFSVGEPITGVPATVLTFEVSDSGLVNREFQQVRPDGNCYCYQDLGPAIDPTGQWSYWGYEGLILMAMPDENTLHVQAVPEADSCGSGPWSLTEGQYTAFER